MLINSPNISGSLTVTGNSVISGSLNVLGSITGAITGSATTASYVEFANVADKPTLVSGSEQISFNGIVDKPTLVSGSEQITYSGLTGIPSGIVSGSAQIADFGIFATTGSNQFNGNQAITGSLTTTGTIVAQTLNVQQVTSSIVYSSGSNIFGNSLANTQQFTGSLQVTGSTHHVLGNVGVGTTSPELRLDVKDVATGGSIGMFIENAAASTLSNSADIYFGTWGGASIDGITNARISAVNVDAGNAATDLRFHTYNGSSSAERMRITSDGNVLIGATSDISSARRELVMRGANGSLVSLGNNITADRFQIASDSGENALINNKANTPMVFYTNNTERIRISAAGALLVGTTNTYSNLATQGDIVLQDRLIFGADQTGSANNRNWSIETNSSQNGSFDVVSSSANNNWPNAAYRFTITRDGQVGIGITPTAILHIADSSGATRLVVDNTSNAAAGAGIYMRTYGGGSLVSNATIRTDNAGNFAIFTGTSSDAERMRITSGGLIGINTTSPFNFGTGSGMIDVRSQNTSAVSGVFISNSDASARLTMYINNAAAATVGTSTNHALQLVTNDIERMRIAANGNIGIATNNPGQALDVIGNIRSNNVIFWNNGVGALSWDTGLVTMETNTSTAIVFKTNGNERMRITSGGNVGIGTTSPFSGAELDVYGDLVLGQQNWAIRGNNSFADIGFEELSGGGFSDANYKLYLQSGGNVGIGTTSPSTKLHIRDNFDPDDSLGYLLIENTAASTNATSNSAVNVKNYSGTSQFMQWENYGLRIGSRILTNGGAGDVYFTSGADSAGIVLKASGNVGIGTSSPSVQFNVGHANHGIGMAYMGASSLPAIAGLFTDTSSGQQGYGSLLVKSRSDYAGYSINFFTAASANTPVERLRITSTGTVQPGANGTQDLGTSSLRWATVYTSDLSLSNGIGDYTIVEGEHDLFLYNNKNNKVYKFLVEEVDPSTATPKKS